MRYSFGMSNEYSIQDRYFDHDADIGIIGRGQTIEAAFEDAASSTFALMIEPTKIKPVKELVIEFDEDELDYALVTWLNSLLAQARSHGLALCKFKLTKENNHWRGLAWGEPWKDEFDLGVEVKGATLTMLTVNDDNGMWEARCVVDV